jgi:hypothetical protein
MREFTNEEMCTTAIEMFKQLIYPIMTFYHKKDYLKVLRLTLYDDVYCAVYWKKAFNYSLHIEFMPMEHYTLNEDDTFLLNDLRNNYFTPKVIKSLSIWYKKNSSPEIQKNLSKGIIPSGIILI